MSLSTGWKCPVPSKLSVISVSPTRKASEPPFPPISASPRLGVLTWTGTVPSFSRQIASIGAEIGQIGRKSPFSASFSCDFHWNCALFRLICPEERGWDWSRIWTDRKGTYFTDIVTL